MVAFLLCAAVAEGCAPGTEPGPSGERTDEPAVDARPQPEPLADFCAPGARPWATGLDSTAALVDMLNSLPRPLDLPCALSALPRPVTLVGSKNIISAQPAAGAKSPRVFVRAGGTLIVSITLAGDASSHIETAEVESEGYSIKGDLTFPLTGAVSERDLYASILNGTSPGTACSGCHAGERQVRTIGDVPVYTSRALAPISGQKVLLPGLQSLHDECAGTSAGDTRCQMLRALFRDANAVGAMEWLAGTTTLF